MYALEPELVHNLSLSPSARSTVRPVIADLMHCVSTFRGCTGIEPAGSRPHQPVFLFL